MHAIFVFCICYPLLAVAERIPLVCDELGFFNEAHMEPLIQLSDMEEYGIETEESDGEEEQQMHSIYCTVSNFRVEYTTQVDCDVYPREREHIKVVRFSNSKMIHIPNGIFRYFGNIREFDISSSQIEAVHRNFEGAKNLVFLIMSHNNITELGPSLFVDSPTLTVLDLSHNQISKMSRYAFAEARSLSRLVLTHNRINELDDRLFKDLRFLDQLYLDHNEIETIPNKLFSGNLLLQKIILSDNRITTLECHHYGGFKYLDTLHLANNKISDFDPECLASKLDSLNLNGNNLTRLAIKNVISLQASNNSITEVIISDNGSELENLYVSNNSLTNVQNITEKLTNLQILDVSLNRIGKLNITTFGKLKNLVKLDLENTSISDLDFGTFANQRELTFLDISYNSLNSLNCDIFLPYLNKLEELYVGGNNLTEIGGTGHIGQNFPHLRILSFSNNNFNCTYLSNFFRVLAFSKIQISYDTELMSNVNTTHVHGISCESNQNKNRKQELPTITHLQPVRSHEFQLLKSEIEYFYRSDSKTIHKIDALHSRMSSQEIQYERLLAESRNIKYFVCLVAISGFIFIGFRYTKKYLENRYFKVNLHPRGCYPSTATMNTLQSTIPY